MAEEAAELRASETPTRREEEFGDLLLALVGAAHRMDIDPEQALRGANDRFTARFQRVEESARRGGHTLAEMPTDAKLALWDQAKAVE